MTDTAVNLSSEALLARARRVLLAEQRALALLGDGLDDGLVRAAECIAANHGRVLVAGMGKSGIAARKLAATLCSLKVPAHFLHPADALHGDMGAVSQSDMVVAISVSGETRELNLMMRHVRELGAATVAITARPYAPLARDCDHLLLLPDCGEASELAAPMASTIATIAMGDALASLVAAIRGTARGDMVSIHPAGELGRQLRPIGQIMHGGDRVPLVTIDAPAAAFVQEMTLKGFGITGVLDRDGMLVGTISDGDVRRAFDALETRLAGEVMATHPVTLGEDADVGEAMERMRTHRISAIFVVDKAMRVSGLIHLQDLLRIGVL